MSDRNLEHYGVFRTLDKGTMTPEDIRDAVLEGIEKKMSAPELGVQKLNQQLRQIESEAPRSLPTAQSQNTPTQAPSEPTNPESNAV